MRFFADTYALMAHFDGRASYRGLLDEHFATTAVNLAEFAHTLLLRGRTDVAELVGRLEHNLVEPSSKVAVAAAEFRRSANRAGGRISTVDAWGYATAQSLGMSFLTGDEEFRGIPGVTFVKA